MTQYQAHLCLPVVVVAQVQGVKGRQVEQTSLQGTTLGSVRSLLARDHRSSQAQRQDCRPAFQAGSHASVFWLNLGLPAQAHLAILLEVGEALVLEGAEDGVPEHHTDLEWQREVDLRSRWAQ